MIDPTLRSAAERWLAEDPDAETRAELAAVLEANDAAGLADRFAGSLEFGTAGLRGVLGAGPNRMNRAVVIRTTAGLAAYLHRTLPDCAARGVVIGYDGRRGSGVFARDTAALLAGAGIPAWVFNTLAPTPLTAFAVRHLRAAAGVMVTASHNPPEYNGYKVYWENGAQIIPPHDTGIAAAITAVGPIPSLPRREEAEARKLGLYRDVPAETIEAYYAAVRALVVGGGERASLRIVYTAMHGVGGAPVLRALLESGFRSVTAVPAQQEPDGNFPTVRFPNPEEPGAMDLSLALAEREKAELVLANDPDADRLAVAVPVPGGGYRMLSGNQVGVLLAGHLLANDASPRSKQLVINSIVSSPMLARMAGVLGVRAEEVLTGFKWIANRALELEAAEGLRFVMGYEEALGYSVGTVCRDKDGVSAAVVFAALAADAKARGSSVLGELEALYRRYGLYTSGQHNVTAKGATGQARIAKLMSAFRAAPPTEIGGLRVTVVKDYQAGTSTPAGGAPTKLSLPPSNVLTFELEGGSRVMMRPSGTEPKIKYYFDVREEVRAGEPLEAAEARAKAKQEALSKDFVARADAAAPA